MQYTAGQIPQRQRTHVPNNLVCLFFFCLKGEKRNHCTFLAKSTFEIKDVTLTICEQ